MKQDGRVLQRFEQPGTRIFSGKVRRAVPGCQVARRCDRSKIPCLDLGSKVSFVSMQSKCYEAGHQQRCAGHDEAHCHSASSCMMQGSIRRVFFATGNTKISRLFKEMRARRPPSTGPRSQKTSIIFAAQRGPEDAQALRPLIGWFVTPLNCHENT